MFLIDVMPIDVNLDTPLHHIIMIKGVVRGIMRDSECDVLVIAVCDVRNCACWVLS